MGTISGVVCVNTLLALYALVVEGHVKFGNTLQYDGITFLVVGVLTVDGPFMATIYQGETNG